SEAFRQRGHEFLVRACARIGGEFARWRRGRAFCGAPSGHIALPDHTQTTPRPHSDHTQTTLRPHSDHTGVDRVGAPEENAHCANRSSIIEHGPDASSIRLNSGSAEASKDRYWALAGEETKAVGMVPGPSLRSQPQGREPCQPKGAAAWSRGATL